ncbi:MAG TPA: CoA pyrophosphatase [Acidimicrobiales bacterium]|nr:CoA pyrophosphatase [Acidimicrobiales bacterium]
MIPRPATAEPGGPPPWTPRRGITLGDVLEALDRGRGARSLEDGPPPHPAGIAAEPASVVAAPSAVLVPLFEEAGEARVVLTRRSTTLRTHRGQVSFPGGRIEPGEDAVAAALREAHEEIGLDPALARPVGYLTPAFAFSSLAPITPVVASLPGRPMLVANPAEVDRAFDASLADLCAAYSEEWWSEPGLPRFPMYFFAVEGETIWGATARMVVDLLTAVLVGDAPGP